MFNIDPDCGGIEGLVLFEGFIDKILIEGFPLDAIQGFVNRDFNIAKVENRWMMWEIKDPISNYRQSGDSIEDADKPALSGARSKRYPHRLMRYTRESFF